MSQPIPDFYFPEDHRLRAWVRRRELVTFLVLALAPVVLSWVYYLAFGLPVLLGIDDPASAKGPHGFPLWLRSAHYLNLFLLVLLVRSGLQILMDHPRLYWSVHSTPGTEWARFTPLAEVPTDRPWTSKHDARYLPGWIGLPGGRHTVGLARLWHFPAALAWSAVGIAFVTLLGLTGQWTRIVPNTWRVIPEAAKVFVHYATFHMPPEPDGFYQYNSLQELTYFAIVFLAGPLTIATGLAMSPAIDGRFAWYPRLFGNHQAARSIHFLLMVSYLGFTAVHVFFVVITGVIRNLDHIVLGSDEMRISGPVLALAGIAVIVLANFGANWACWHRARVLQRLTRPLVEGLTRRTLDPLRPSATFREEDISPRFWANGELPTSDEWKALAADGFRDYRLEVGGLVDRPASFTLDEIRGMDRREQITQHHCIQGWTGIAAWAGLPLANLIERVGPRPEARFVVFRSFGEGLMGGEYYDCHSLDDARHPQSLLAYEMNHETLNDLHGAPLRLRVENQLGYKMVKWIRSIEFVAGVKEVGKGYGGKNEDDEYYALVANL